MLEMKTGQKYLVKVHGRRYKHGYKGNEKRYNRL